MEMQLDNTIIKFLEHSSILVTGVTGFLAKVFVEKVLRVQPNIKNIYCLIRAPDAKSASKRFQNEVIAKPLFTTLKEKLGDDFSSFITEKVTLVPGDIAFENFGLTDINLLEEMWRNVTMILNVAATINFDERYDTSLRINTIGAKHILNFARKCVNTKIFLQVSTGRHTAPLDIMTSLIVATVGIASGCSVGLLLTYNSLH